MQQAVAARTPAHLWIVGILSLLWNCFGAYDYLMTRMRNMDYLASMGGRSERRCSPRSTACRCTRRSAGGLACGRRSLGSVLLLMRSRYAVQAFALSLSARWSASAANILDRRRRRK